MKRPLPPPLPGKLAQVFTAVEEDVVEPDERRITTKHLLADVLAAEPLLKRVEARRRTAVDIGDALVGAAHQQLAVEDTRRTERLGDIGETAGNVVAGTAVEPGLSAGMDQLDSDAVPFPLGRIIIERDSGLLERMGEHERPEHRHVAHGRLARASFRPIEELAERGAEAVPHLLDSFDVEPEGIGQRLLRQPRADPDPERACGKLQQREPPGRIEMVEHVGEHARRIHA